MLKHLEHDLEAVSWLPWIWVRYMCEAHFNFCDLMIWGDATLPEMKELIQMRAA